MGQGFLLSVGCGDIDMRFIFKEVSGFLLFAFGIRISRPADEVFFIAFGIRVERPVGGMVSSRKILRR